MTLYCTKCGKKHDFTLERPKFCSECGKSFNGDAKAQTPSTNKGVTTQAEEEDNDKEVPQIIEIQAEVETDTRHKIAFANVKNAPSFAREKPRTPLSIEDLNARTEKLFERDRQDTKENK